MAQKVSKLDAARILAVSPSTIDRRIERGELEIEHEPRGNSYKVWVLLDDAAVAQADDRPAAGPSGEAAAEVVGVAGAPSNAVEESTEIRLLKQENQHLKELAEVRKDALNESEKRFHELLEGFNASQRTVETLTRALNPGPETTVATPRRQRWWRSIFR